MLPQLEDRMDHCNALQGNRKCLPGPTLPCLGLLRTKLRCEQNSDLNLLDVDSPFDCCMDLPVRLLLDYTDWTFDCTDWMFGCKDFLGDYADCPVGFGDLICRLICHSNSFHRQYLESVAHYGDYFDH